MRGRKNPLELMFAPKSVAVVGASDRKGQVAGDIFRNLLVHPFGGAVYPVNASRPHVGGVRAFPSIQAIGSPVRPIPLSCHASTKPRRSLVS